MDILNSLFNSVSNRNRVQHTSYSYVLIIFEFGLTNLTYIIIVGGSQCWSKQPTANTSKFLDTVHIAAQCARVEGTSRSEGQGMGQGRCCNLETWVISNMVRCEHGSVRARRRGAYARIFEL
jgi:hypothetical protein